MLCVGGECSSMGALAKVVAEDSGELEQAKALIQVAQFPRKAVVKRHHEITIFEQSTTDSFERGEGELNQTGNTRVSASDQVQRFSPSNDESSRYT
jgi:hypothetical protein